MLQEFGQITQEVLRRGGFFVFRRPITEEELQAVYCETDDRRSRHGPAGIERFNPYDLRRTAATRIRSQFSKDAARLILGHVSTDTTEIYLLEEVQESMKLAKQLDAGEG